MQKFQSFEADIYDLLTSLLDIHINFFLTETQIWHK